MNFQAKSSSASTGLASYINQTIPLPCYMFLLFSRALFLFSLSSWAIFFSLYVYETMGYGELIIRSYDAQSDRARVEDLERRCEVGPAERAFLFTDTLGDPICRIRNSPIYKMLVPLFSFLFSLVILSFPSFVLYLTPDHYLPYWCLIEKLNWSFYFYVR